MISAKFFVRNTFHLILSGSIIAGALFGAQPAHAAVSDWQEKSISIYPTSPTDFTSSAFQQTVTHFKSLGFNSVTLVVQLYQSNVNSTDIGPGGNTPTDASLISAITYIHSQGMQVLLTIHLDPKDGQWRAYINPNDRAGWYTNYLAQLSHYGQIAQTNGVEAYSLGVELIDMASSAINPDNTQQWQNIISNVRNIYKGQLTYDANWGGDKQAGEARYIEFWSALDFIGISAYYELPGDGSIAQNESAWNTWNTNEIQPLYAKWNKPIAFTEMGYRSVQGAHLQPYNSWQTGSYDPQEQVNAYQALLDYWNKYPYMQGISVWYQIPNTSVGGAGDTDYLVQHKPVEMTFSSWFGSTPPPPPPTPAAFSVIGSVSSTTVTTSQPVIFTTTIKDTGGSAAGEIIDLELFDSTGHQVSQKIYSAQNFSSGQTQTYALVWTPTISGTYTFKVGVFNGDWNLLTWNDSVSQVNVTTDAGPPTNQVLDIWWPGNDATVSGIQPFKALLENTYLATYNMYWQVDGGSLNQMSDSSVDYPHKESSVDVSVWTSKGSGPYTVNFIAKDTSGSVLSQKVVKVYVAQ